MAMLNNQMVSYSREHDDDHHREHDDDHWFEKMVREDAKKKHEWFNEWKMNSNLSNILRGLNRCLPGACHFDHGVVPIRMPTWGRPQIASAHVLHNFESKVPLVFHGVNGAISSGFYYIAIENGDWNRAFSR